MDAQLRDDLEVNLVSGSRYINKISESLKGRLPDTVTKEELMNFYLHNMQEKGSIETNVTVVNLVQAANLANIRVKGQSVLEVNVSIRDQLKYLNTTGIRHSKRKIRKELQGKETLIKNCLEEGISIAEIARRFDCCRTTVTRFLDNRGIRQKRSKKLKEMN